MNQDQRKFLSDKLGELGNFAVLALIFTVLVSDKEPRPWLALAGWLIWLICHSLGLWLLRSKNHGC